MTLIILVTIYLMITLTIPIFSFWLIALIFYLIVAISGFIHVAITSRYTTFPTNLFFWITWPIAAISIGWYVIAMAIDQHF